MKSEIAQTKSRAVSVKPHLISNSPSSLSSSLSAAMGRARYVLPIVLALLPGTAGAYQAVSQSTAIDVTAEITAIDYDSRVVVLEDEGGNVEWVYAEPEIKRFNELKVGDKVTFRYYESVLSQIRKASGSTEARTS